MRCFGPIPSRRLGRSLGINNIPPKICTYACVYCQQGASSHMQVARQEFYDPTDLFQEVKDKVELLHAQGEKIDYLTIVPDGEPTLDIHLGDLIDQLKSLALKVAVITNGSLLDQEDVIQELARADLVSVKADSALESLWRKVNHPLKQIDFSTMQAGIIRFSQQFEGELLTETMLVRDLNDTPESLHATARFIATLDPSAAYLSIPTRPPALKWVKPPREETIHEAWQIFRQYLNQVEYLIGYEGSDFAFSGDIEKDLLSICAIHPMRREAIEEMLHRAQKDWEVIQAMISQDKLVEIDFDGHKFYMRKLYAGYKR